MTRINLLPHRQEKRRARRQQFFALAGLVSVVGAVVVFLVFSVIAGYIGAQDEKNRFLTEQIAVLDKQIAQIKDLQGKIQALLSRKQIIEALQRDRAESVMLFNEMAKQMPEGVYLRTLKQDGLKISLSGVSTSNSRVSTLMRNIEASPALDAPVLVETKAAMIDRRPLNEFGMSAQIKRAKVDDASAKGAK